MIFGIGAAITWALDTVILGIALAAAVFSASPMAIALASFTSTFLHDACSALYTLAYLSARRKLRAAMRTFFSRNGLVVAGAALVGAPLGMTGYVVAIDNIGPAYTAAISAFFPAWGALLSTVLLKERMKGYQWVGLSVCLVSVAALSWSPAANVPGNWAIGIAAALACVFGWGTEAVIIDWKLRDASIDDECAMQIREIVSALTYALIILPVLGGWSCALDALRSSAMPFIAMAAFCGTVSYLLYYKAIARLGAARAMALNITYSAWTIPFSLIMLGAMPDLRGMMCALLIIVGAIVAATDLPSLLGTPNRHA